MDDLLYFVFGYVTRMPSMYGDSTGRVTSIRIYALLPQNAFMRFVD
jgi:hypothetical protein